MKIYGNKFSPNGNKVLFAANAMNIAYEYQEINLAAGEQRQDWFLKINPIGRIPALVDGDFTIIESNSIMRYMAEKTASPLYPNDIKKRNIVNQWLDFISIHVGAGAMTKIFFNVVVYKLVNAEKDERSLKEGRQFLQKYLQILDKQLTNGKYICGNDMSLADLNLLAILDSAEIVEVDLSAFPKVAEWRKRLQSQEFYRKVFPETYTGFANKILSMLV